MKDGCYYAHTENEQGKMHTLEDHLLSVANKTQDFARKFYNGQFTTWAKLIGLLHDLGKAHPSFQKYLRTVARGEKHPKFPHSPWSSYFVYLLLDRFECKHDIALAVAGHHAGLNEIGNLTVNLKNLRYEKDVIEIMLDIFRKLIKDDPKIDVKGVQLNVLQRELLIRMLFSALVDADRLDTEAHFEPKKYLLRENKSTLEELAAKLRKDQQQLIEKKERDASTTNKMHRIVNKVRKVVYEACLQKAESKTGFYRLTVPTGGGKTRSALAFALEHALANSQERVIFALPYTSIIDQTAEVYRKILGEEAVLEHHSQAVLSENEEEGVREVRLRLSEENWDLPVVVTTTVQLFESLFANRSSRCRKLHRLARSVIVLDEAQTLPTELLKPTIQVLRDLVDNYGTTVVLSTATQPALQEEYLSELKGIEITEIVPDYSQHFETLKRVRYERLSGSLSIHELSSIISQHEQVLVIMNTRKKALELLEAMKDEHCLHLSTFMCGAHRRKVLEKVRQLLDMRKPVRLISTQVVEAGVDLDFPVVYRAIGPLDRIVQAAGRCNREGKNPHLGKVVIFELTDERSPRGPYKVGMEEAKRLLAEYETPEVLADPEIYKTYFARLYRTMGGNLDAKKIQEKRSKLDFPGTAAAYRLIEDDTIPVIVKYGGYKQVLDKWTENPTRDNWRELQQYLVNIYRWEAKKFINEGLMWETYKDLYLWEGVYDQLKGIGEFEWDPSDLII